MKQSKLLELYFDKLKEDEQKNSNTFDPSCCLLFLNWDLLETN